MGNVRIKLNSGGVRELLKSEEVEKMCMDFANSAVAKLGNSYAADVRRYPERTASIVLARSYEAKNDNVDNNTILKALR